MTSVTGMAGDTCVALGSGASILLASRKTRCTCIDWAGPAIRMASLTSVSAGIWTGWCTRSAIRMAGLTSVSTRVRTRCRTCILTASRVTCATCGTVSNWACVALRSWTGVVARKTKVRAWNRDRRLGGSSQLDIEIELIRGCTRIVLPRNALSCSY